MNKISHTVKTDFFNGVEKELMNKRVFGVSIIGAKMANWNAGFDSDPKMTSNNEIYGSDKAMKFSIRQHWVNQNKKVLFFKEMVEKKGKIVPMSLQERFLKLNNLEKMPKDEKESILHLFSAIDVMNFGAAFLTKTFSISIPGCVQFSQGFNIYEEAEIEEQSILSPFPSDNEKTQSSIGTLHLVDEAHYVYPFSVNPIAYRNYAELLGMKGLYTVEAYNAFKKSSLKGASSLNTVTKTGTYNEFGLFVELKEGSELYVPPLHDFISFNREENTLDLKRVTELLDKLQDDIETVEIYANELKINVINNGSYPVHSIFDVR